METYGKLYGSRKLITNKIKLKMIKCHNDLFGVFKSSISKYEKQQIYHLNEIRIISYPFFGQFLFLFFFFASRHKMKGRE